MPKMIHEKLVKEALKKGLSEERKDSYVYGTLQKIENSMKRRKGKKAR